MKKSELSLLMGLVCALAVSYFATATTQAQTIRNETLRLHVIAEDDSPTAQEIKLLVKDEVLKICSEIYCPARNLDDALAITGKNMDYIEKVANHTLQECGADYSAVCTIENFWFDTTEYEDFTMPRGEYTALTVRLGKAQGKNWWCVAYPALCTGGSTKYEDDASNTFIETDSFRLKFKAVELYEKAKAFFSHTEKYNNL